MCILKFHWLVHDSIGFGDCNNIIEFCLSIIHNSICLDHYNHFLEFYFYFLDSIDFNYYDNVHPWVPFLCLWFHWFQLLRLHILEFYFYLCDSNVDSSYCGCICEFHFYLHDSIDFAYYDHNLKFLSIGFKLHWCWSLWLYPWVSFIIQVPLILVIDFAYLRRML